MSAGTDAGGPQEPSAQGIDHLQRAGRELIAAARSFLDAAEQLVEDRGRLAEVAGSVTGLVEDLAGGLRGAGRGPGVEDLQPWETGARPREAEPSGTEATGAAPADVGRADTGSGDTGSGDAGPGGADRSSGGAPRPSRVRRIPVD